MDISAPSAVFNRVDKTIHFERGLNAVRGRQTISAAAAVAHLSEDEERLQAIELRGNSKIGGTQGGVGGLRALTGRDIDLTLRTRRSGYRARARRRQRRDSAGG